MKRITSEPERNPPTLGFRFAELRNKLGCIVLAIYRYTSGTSSTVILIHFVFGVGGEGEQ